MKKTAARTFLFLFLVALLVSCSPVSGESSDGVLEVYFLDVGQGDATLVKFPSGKWMLIDGGERHQGEKVITMLREAGVEQLDIIVATHPDSDHIGGLPKVIDAFPVESVYAPKVKHTTKTYQDFLLAVQKKGVKIRTAQAGVELDIGKGSEAVMVGPVKEYPEKDKNSWSAVLRIKHGENTFLLTGDATIQAEQDMIEDGQPLQAIVLKVGHHGSDTSTGPDFLAEVKPEIAVISLGKNSYGHPSPDVLHTLSKAGVRDIYRTDEHGTIRMISDKKSLEIQESKSSDDDGDPQDDGQSGKEKEEGPFVGSKNSDVYHKSDCPDVERIKPENRVYFSSEEEAQADGRRRSKSSCWD